MGAATRDTSKRKGKGGRDRRRRKSHLGMWSSLAVLLLLAGYVATLELSRPHVAGDRLRFDRLINLVADGRVRDARILDEDAYVVGTYLKGGVVPQAEVDLDGGGSHGMGGMGGGHGGGLLSAAAQAPEDPARDPPGSVRRPFNAPLLRANANSTTVVELLIANGVPTTIDQQVGKRIASVASLVLPALIVVVVFVYLILSYQRGTGVFNIRSGARKIERGESSTTFADVAGQDAAVQELKEVRDFLADPGRFAAVGAKVPRGILLFGPPGCGKTLLARALAGEAGASFFSISGADFVEMFLGVGAARVRDLFAEAREHAPAIVFIDELDAVGKRRRGGPAGGGTHEEHDQALNQLLTEMDGFSPLEGIVVVGATNRPDVLDPALLRPGRFDRPVGLERPDEAGRLAILEVHARSKPLEPDVDLSAVARRAVGLSGADLGNVVNEAALLAARAGKVRIGQGELTDAVQRVLEAPERQRRLSMRDRSFSRATGADQRVTFADIAGADEAIAELTEVREYLTDPERFARMGARPPRGFLLVGPPGCGKTLLARAVANESGATFFSVAGTEFVEVFVGEGAGRVRDLFAEARAAAPSVVFIDEIDAVGGRRGAGSDGQREREQTLNQILVELDGFSARSGVTVLAATNRVDILDEALVRPGRFDRTVTIDRPDRDARAAILALHATGKRIGPDVDLTAIARLTSGYSGADLANVMNEAALLAARHRLDRISTAIVEEAVERQSIGLARARKLTDNDRAMIAYHEVGHALVGRALPGADPPHRLSIIARGHSLGATWLVDDVERAVVTRSVLVDRMAALLGGRAAEELVFGEPASGAWDDLRKVRTIAVQMVRDFAMSERIGPVAAGDSGRPGPHHNESEDEVRRLIHEAHALAIAVLTSERAGLDRAAAALAERETLTADELEELVGPPPVAAPVPR